MSNNDETTKNNDKSNETHESKETVADELSNVSKIKKEADPDPTAQIRNDYLYLRAEFDNYKKNAIKERSDLLKYGGERLAYDLLNILDVFEKALKMDVNATNFAAFKEGIQLTAVEFKKTLEKHGINEIPSMGATFDPNLHEALSQVPTKDKKDDTIIELFRKGYKYHDKVLRHSQVVVAKEVKD